MKRAGARWAAVFAALAAGCGDDEPPERGPGAPIPDDLRILQVGYVLDPDLHEKSPHFIEPLFAGCLVSSCSGESTAPALGSPTFMIDDMLYDTLEWTRSGEQVHVLLPIVDAECNAGCGLFTDEYEMSAQSGISHEAQVSVGGTSPSNVPCDSAVDKLLLGARLGVLEYDPQHYDGIIDDFHYVMSIADTCGAESNRVVMDFELYH